MFCSGFNSRSLYINTKKTIIISFILSISLIIGQNGLENKIDPVIKSAIIPGWGQKSLNYNDRAKVFNYVESGIILTIVGTSTYSNILKKNYISFASQHARLSSSDKDHKYWVDIGNYNSIDDYNSEHLRNREINDLYPVNNKWNWNWDSEANRKAFEDKRITSDQMKLISTFGFGALVLNHAISVIDVLYLKRLSVSKKVYINPYQNMHNGSFGYSIIINI